MKQNTRSNLLPTLRGKARTRQASLVLASGTIISRMLGFLRDAFLAHILGAGPVSDAFLVAFRIPNFMRRLFSEGAIALAFVPAFIEEYAKNKALAFTFSKAALASVSIFFALCTLALSINAWPVTFGLAPGFSENGLKMGNSVYLFRICIWYLPFCATAGIASSILLGMSRYAGQSLNQAMFNTGMLIAGILALYLGDNTQNFIVNREFRAAKILAFGIIGGGVLQCLLQFFFLYKAKLSDLGKGENSTTFVSGKSSNFPVCFFSEAHKLFWKKLPSVLAGSGGQQLGMLLCTMIASMLEAGSITTLYLAERLFELPLGLTGAVQGIAALPALSLAGLAFSQKKDLVSGELFKKNLHRHLEITLLLSFPAGIGMAIVAYPLAELLFGHGAFEVASVHNTAMILVVYCTGLPAAALIRPLLSAVNTLKMPRLGLYSTIILLSFILIFGIPMSNYSGAAGLAGAVVLGTWGSMFFLSVALNAYSAMVCREERSRLLKVQAC